jgi:hypothetical protein
MRRAWITAAALAVAVAAGAARAADDEAPDQACLARLRAEHVDFAVEQPTKGVRTPIRLAGSVGPLRLVPRAGGAQSVMDCALAAALLDSAPLFQAAGVRDLVYSGIYQWRTRRGSTKLSEHAHGLAIDVHVFAAPGGGARYDVERDFQKGVGQWAVTDADTCVGAPTTPAARTLRRLACTLRASSAFREIITADDNADHANHFHIEAFPDPLTRARAILAHHEPVIDD